MLIFSTVIKTFLGKGSLSHLWFVMALLFIYLFMHLLYRIRGRVSTSQVFDIRGVTVIALLLSAVFLTSIFLHGKGLPEIRELTWAPLRVVTSLSYFFLGMLMHKYGERLVRIDSLILLLTAAAGYASTCLLSATLQMYWASSFYDSVFVAGGCCALCILCLKYAGKTEEHALINRLSVLTVGVWVLHPFAWRAVRKVLAVMDMPLSLPLRLVMLFPVIAGCAFGSKLARRIPVVKRFFTF